VGTKSYRVVPANRGQNLSCMCVISMNGLVHMILKEENIILNPSLNLKRITWLNILEQG
jgi:hypothetical protein